MGVSRVFVLVIGDRILMGPRAYYYLVGQLNMYRGEGVPLPQISDIRFPPGGWRKRIKPLFQLLQRRVGGMGNLRQLSRNNPMGDTWYRNVVASFGRRIRLKTPRRTGGR